MGGNFGNHVSNKGLISDIYKELNNRKKKVTQLKK